MTYDSSDFSLKRPLIPAAHGAAFAGMRGATSSKEQKDISKFFFSVSLGVNGRQWHHRLTCTFYRTASLLEN